MTKEMLPDLLYGVLRDMGGHGSIIGICKRFWSKYENELKIRVTCFIHGNMTLDGPLPLLEKQVV